VLTFADTTRRKSAGRTFVQNHVHTGTQKSISKKRRAYLRSCWKNPVLHSKLLKRTRSKMREYRKAAAWKAYILTYNQAYRKTRCACCLRRRRLTADHVHPISKGGRNIIGNIQALCGPCNFSKSSKTGAYTCSACGRHHRKATQRMRFDR